MKPKVIYFVTSNLEKMRDLTALHKKYRDLDVEHYGQEISESRKLKIEDIVRDKALEAYRQLRQPLFVDHTSLSIEAIGGLPGSSSDEFWTSISRDYDAFVKNLISRKVSMSVGLCFTDGRKFFTETAIVQGNLADSPRVKREFGWDGVFVLEGQKKTFSEMNVNQKNIYSARAAAFERLVETIMDKVK